MRLSPTLIYRYRVVASNGTVVGSWPTMREAESALHGVDAPGYFVEDAHEWAGIAG